MNHAIATISVAPASRGDNRYHERRTMVSSSAASSPARLANYELEEWFEHALAKYEQIAKTQTLQNINITELRGEVTELREEVREIKDMLAEIKGMMVEMKETGPATGPSSSSS